MMMRVVYPDDRYDYVNGPLLTLLIERRSIVRFRRSDGWVEVPLGNIRQMAPRERYAGPERRRPRNKPSRVN